jgi:TatD DNase family protein
MNVPQPGDFIDIHNHGGSSSPGKFSIENLMAHEERKPVGEQGLAYTYGIHPWHLSADNYDFQIGKVERYASDGNVIAIGEAGFDRLRGPSPELQKRAFEQQVKIADENGKPVFIHCVRAWDEILAENKRLKPSTPWLIHGFRGKQELAEQLISKGMYISFWFDFIIKSESSSLVKSLPSDRIFLETDGSGVEISIIYNKVSTDLSISIVELKAIIFSNYRTLFNANP